MKRDRPGRLRRPPLSAALVVGLIALGLGLAGLVAPAPAQGQTLPTRTPRPSPSARPTGDLSGIRNTPTPALSPTPIASGSGSCELVVTADDLSSGSVRVGDAPLDGLPNRDPRYTYIRACEVIYTDDGGQIVPNKTFDGPVEVCFRYTPDDVARAGGDPARLTIVSYDEATGQWVELEVVLDEERGLICGRLPRSGIVALVIRAGQLSGLPNTSGEIPEVTPAPAAPQAPAPAPGAAADPAPPAPPADAPAAGQPAQAAPQAAPAVAAGAQPAAPAPAIAAAAPVAPADSGIGLALAVGLGVLAAIVAVIVALSRSMIARAHDE